MARKYFTLAVLLFACSLAVAQDVQQPGQGGAMCNGQCILVPFPFHPQPPPPPPDPPMSEFEFRGRLPGGMVAQGIRIIHGGSFWHGWTAVETSHYSEGGWEVSNSHNISDSALAEKSVNDVLPLIMMVSGGRGAAPKAGLELTDAVERMSLKKFGLSVFQGRFDIMKSGQKIPEDLVEMRDLANIRDIAQHSYITRVQLEAQGFEPIIPGQTAQDALRLFMETESDMNAKLAEWESLPDRPTQ